MYSLISGKRLLIKGRDTLEMSVKSEFKNEQVKYAGWLAYITVPGSIRKDRFLPATIGSN